MCKQNKRLLNRLSRKLQFLPTEIDIPMSRGDENRPVDVEIPIPFGKKSDNGTLPFTKKNQLTG